MSKLIECEPQPEYVYVTIPSEYVCVYHKILAMLADFGEEMLKDCKASCTERNSGVIECYNMFNAAVAARCLGQTKKATLIINYIKAKINQIYKCESPNTGFVFPVDEFGHIKAFVSCTDRPRFWINSEDGVLYKKSMDLGTREEYSLDKRDEPFSDKCDIPVIPTPESPFDCLVRAEIDKYGSLEVQLEFYYEGEEMRDTTLVDVDYYFDKVSIKNPCEIFNCDYGKHILTIVAQYESNLITKSCVVVRGIHDDEDNCSGCNNCE